MPDKPEKHRIPFRWIGTHAFSIFLLAIASVAFGRACMTHQWIGVGSFFIAIGVVLATVNIILLVIAVANWIMGTN